MIEKFYRYYPLFEGLKELLELYQEINLQIDKFKKTTTINCLNLCCKCCSTPSENIEVSIFELFPLAIYLWENNKSNAVLNQILSMDKSAPCIFFNADKIFNETGNCSIYELRPLICRLFGFSVLIDRNDKIKYISCSEIKKKYFKEIFKIESEEKNNSILLVLSYYAQKSASLNFYYSSKRLSINKALQKALEIVALKLN